MWKLQIKQTSISIDGKFDVPERVIFRDKNIQNLLYVVKAMGEVDCGNTEYMLTKEEEDEDGK